MKLTEDISSPKLILLKGWLFFLLSLIALGSLVALNPSWINVALVVVGVWAGCRWYYFMFYVIEHYVDSEFKFAGLTSFVKYQFAQHNKRKN